MFVLLKGLSRKNLALCAPLELISGGEPRYWAPGASSSGVFRLTVFTVLTGHNRLMSSNADSHCIDRFGCFLRCPGACR